MKAWMNGRLLESPRDRALSVLDHGLVVGDGVFEAVAVNDGRPFALTRHLDRLDRSAAGLGLARPDRELLLAGIEATLAGQELPFGRIRITVTSGPGPLGSPRGHGDLTHVVVTEPASRPDPVTAIATVPWSRNEHGALAGLKTTSYAENAKMVEYAIARGASEAVMANTAGMLCEGTGSNVFYVLDGRILTPTLESGCLAGITRELALAWLAEEFEVVEQDAPIDVLRRADEVMISSTTRLLQAVARVDDRELPAPGPIFLRAQEIWRVREAENDDP